MAGEEYVAKSDFWIIMGSFGAIISSAWWWILNKVWGTQADIAANQRQIGKIKEEMDDDLDARAERVGRYFEQFRQEQKKDLQDAIKPLRDDFTELSRRIDGLMARRR